MVQFSSVFKVLPLLVLVSGALAEPRTDHKTCLLYTSDAADE